jgi:hypothetical protein
MGRGAISKPKVVGVAVESDVCRAYGQRRESVGDQAVPSR